MSIFDRMGRVISSNFNALLDKADDPRKSIDLTIEEMRTQVKAARDEVVRAVAAEKQLRAKVEQLDAEAARWSSRAELAIRHGDEGLAREALVQKQRITGERDRAEGLRADQRGQALEMKKELERMEAKVEEFSARRTALAASAAQAKAGPEAPRTGGAAFAEFRRMEAQIEGIDAAVAAQREVDAALGPSLGPGGLTRDEVEARFRALEGGAPAPGGGGVPSAVDEELARLKRKVRVGD